MIFNIDINTVTVVGSIESYPVSCIDYTTLSTESRMINLWKLKPTTKHMNLKQCLSVCNSFLIYFIFYITGYRYDSCTLTFRGW